MIRFCFGLSIQLVPVVVLLLGVILTPFYGAIQLVDMLKAVISLSIPKIASVTENSLVLRFRQKMDHQSQIYFKV
jgi:hypothetical protein